jgi:hypothetical protein
VADHPGGRFRQADGKVKQQSGEIFIGDLMRAIAAAGSSDPQTTATIAKLLGFRLEPAETTPQLEIPSSLAADGFTLPVHQSEQVAPQNDTEDDPKLPVEVLPDERLQYDVTEPEVEYIRAPTKTGLQPALPWPAWERDTATKPLYLPLFLAPWTRGILSEAAATWRAAGAVDIPRALEVLARSTTPAELPRLFTPTLARGCHILVDVSAGMAPFTRDCWELIDAMRSVVGRELVQVFYFKDCPIYGVETEADANRVPFQPPPRATPVLLLSDLGIAAPAFSLRPAIDEDWLQLTHQLRVAACPLLTLVPYPPQRWPRRLSKELTIIQWDRDSTAARVRRAKEKA